MKSEIEVKFLDINHDEMRERLKALGGVCLQPMRLMRRYVVETPEMKINNAFVRVRDEGHMSTMTYKQFDALSVDGAKEIEFEVSDFEAGVDMVNVLCKEQNRASYQESRRENWKVGEVEVMLDEWPWLKPYIEIEGESEAALKDLAEKLGLDWSDAVFGDVMAAYRVEYPHLTEKDTVGNVSEVKFGDELPELLRP